MKKIKLLYRADGGHPVGMGHIMRAIRLIGELSHLFDLEVLLVSRRNSSVESTLEKANLQNLQIHWIPPAPKSMIPILDAESFIDAAKQYEPDVIVVDALDTKDRDMRILSTVGAKIVTQDDRGPGRLYADVIANFLVRDPNPSGLRAGAKLVEGPGYAPLAPEYETAASKRRTNEPDKAAVASVTMGGADAIGLTVRVASGLAAVDTIRHVNFSVGPAFQHIEQLKDITSGAVWKSDILISAPSLLPVFLDSDIAIVAGGITMHEAACCGVPSIAVCQPIDHQLLVANWLQDAGAMLNLGYGVDLDPDVIANAVAGLAEDVSKRQAMAAAGPRTVDGKGIRRIAAEIASIVPV